MGSKFAAVIGTVEVHAKGLHIWLAWGSGGVGGEGGEDVVAVVDACVQGAEI